VEGAKEVRRQVGKDNRITDMDDEFFSKVEWIRAGGMQIDEVEVARRNTMEILEKATIRFERGWRGMVEDLGCLGDCGFFWDGEAVLFGEEVVGVATVLAMRDGHFVARLFPKPLALDECMESSVFFFERFFLEAAEDFGRAMTLPPSQRCRACRAGIAKAMAREKSLLGEGRGTNNPVNFFRRFLRTMTFWQQGGRD
jgi:hypothetical protein